MLLYTLIYILYITFIPTLVSLKFQDYCFLMELNRLHPPWIQAHTYQFVKWKHPLVILSVWKTSSAFIYDIHKVPIPVFTQRLGTEAPSGSQGTGLFLSLDLCSFKAV